MDPHVLAAVLAVFLVEGVLASALTVSDPHWWYSNLSAVGMTRDLSAAAFNITLIVAGIFPVSNFFLLHTLIASGMAVVFGALVLTWIILFIRIAAALQPDLAAGPYALSRMLSA